MVSIAPLPAAPATAPDQAEVAARLRLSANRIARILRQQAEVGLSPSQYTALATIAREGPLTLGTLAETEHVKPPSVTKVVEILEEQGLIARRTDPHDGRRVLVAATDAGRSLLVEARIRKDAILSRRIALLDEGQLARLAAALDVLDVLAGTTRS